MNKDPLTKREYEIIMLIATRMDESKEIAHLLDISPRTVDVHIWNIQRILNLNTRTAIARWYWQQQPHGNGEYREAWTELYNCSGELGNQETMELMDNIMLSIKERDTGVHDG